MIPSVLEGEIDRDRQTSVLEGETDRDRQTDRRRERQTETDRHQFWRGR